VLAQLGLAGAAELKELLGLFKRKGSIIFITTTQRFHVIEADSDDNKFIECDESFWFTVIQWFCNNTMLDPAVSLRSEFFYKLHIDTFSGTGRA